MPNKQCTINICKLLFVLESMTFIANVEKNNPTTKKKQSYDQCLALDELLKEPLNKLPQFCDTQATAIV